MKEIVNYVKDGEKMSFTMAFCWKNIKLSVESGQIVSTANGHVVALKLSEINVKYELKFSRILILT